MNRYLTGVLLLAGMLVPCVVVAQSGGHDEVQKLHTILEKLYEDMIPLCEKLTTVARGIAGFGAIFYIVVRAGRSLANAEPIDFFPLLRPFVLAILIGMYPLVLKTIDGVLKPTVEATGDLVKNSNKAVKELLDVERQLRSSGKVQFPVGSPVQDDVKEWYKYAHPDQDGKDEQSGGFWSLVWGKVEGTFTYYIKLIVAKILQIVFFAAALCVDAMRTFHLVILGIIGPFVFALSAYDGFQHTLSIWLARFINVYFWLPVANLFGAMIAKIQQNMIKSDIDAVLGGGMDLTYDMTNLSYLVFLIIGIIGYFSVPSIANYIVHASGGNVLMSKVTGMIRTGATMVATGGAGAASASAGASTGGASAAGSAAADGPSKDRLSYPMSDAANSEGYRKDAGYQQKQISG